MAWRSWSARPGHISRSVKSWAGLTSTSPAIRSGRASASQQGDPAAHGRADRNDRAFEAVDQGDGVLAPAADGRLAPVARWTGRGRNGRSGRSSSPARAPPASRARALVPSMSERKPPIQTTVGPVAPHALEGQGLAVRPGQAFESRPWPSSREIVPGLIANGGKRSEGQSVSDKKVLFVTSNRIGDCVISSGIIREIGRQVPGAPDHRRLRPPARAALPLGAGGRADHHPGQEEGGRTLGRPVEAGRRDPLGHGHRHPRLGPGLPDPGPAARGLQPLVGDRRAQGRDGVAPDGFGDAAGPRTVHRRPGPRRGRRRHRSAAGRRRGTGADHRPGARSPTSPARAGRPTAGASWSRG